MRKLKILAISFIVLFCTTLFVLNLQAFGAKKPYIEGNEKMVQNYKDGRFYNIEPQQNNIKFTQGIKFLLGIKAENVEPKQNLPYIKLKKDHFNKASANARITWFGHSAILLELDNKFIFIDPMLSQRASPLPIFGAKRFGKQLPIALDDLPNLDVVLISHDHYDHLDYKTIKAIKHKVKKFIVPLGVGSHLVSWGVKKEKITELDWYKDIDVDTIKFTLTPSRHFSGRSLKRNTTLWGSFVIKGANENIFFSSDSGYTKYFKEIGQKFGPFDLAFIENGQYNEQWKSSHMHPEESVKAVLDLKAKVAMPLHWGSFVLSTHSWKEPVEEFTKHAELKNITYVTPLIGQSFTLKENLPNKKWWQGLE